MYELVLNQFVSLPKFHADPDVAETYSSTVTPPQDICRLRVASGYAVMSSYHAAPHDYTLLEQQPWRIVALQDACFFGRCRASWARLDSLTSSRTTEAPRLILSLSGDAGRLEAPDFALKWHS
jgi:hypothetical protein